MGEDGKPVTRWQNLGIAFYKDGEITGIKMEALPVPNKDGEIWLRLFRKSLKQAVVITQEEQSVVIKKVKKLWQGKYVSVRDYEVAKAIRQGGMRIKHGDDMMQLDVSQLEQLKPTGRFHQSKFNGEYQLVDITFKPLTEHPDQGSLL